MPRPRMLVLTLIASSALAATAHLGSRPAHAAPQPTSEPPREVATPAPLPGGDSSDRLHQIDSQIKALRAEFHAAIDPLEAQVKATRDKFEPQIASLVEQRKTLAEQSKSPTIQELDRDEASELSGLADREKSELEHVRQRYADERKEIEKKFDERRKQAHAGAH